MANKFSSHLYDLIHSMTSSEKRYFKLDVAKQIGKENKLCIQLFDLIAKSEGKAIEKIEKKIDFTEYPSRLKNYLYESILNSMEDYHAKTSFRIKIRKQINRIENLYDRKLFKQSLVLTKKALKDAEKIDEETFKIQILYWYINNLLSVGGEKNNKLAEKLQAQQAETIDRLKLEKEYSKILNKMSALSQNVEPSFQRLKNEEILKILDTPLMKDYSLATTFYSKLYFISIHAYAYQYLGKIKKAKEYFEKLLKLYDNYPEIKVLRESIFIDVLNNYAVISNVFYDFQTAEACFKRMEEYVPHRKAVIVQIFESLAANKLNTYLTLPNFEKALNMVNFIETGLEKHAEEMRHNFRIVIYSNLAFLFFAAGEHKKALKYNELIQEEEKSVTHTSEIFNYAWMREPLIQYEIGNREETIRSFNLSKKHLEQRGEVKEFEAWFFLFFEKLIQIKEHEKKDFLREEEEKVLSILKKKQENIIDTFNILSWFRTKIDGVSYEEAIRYISSCKGNHEHYLKKVI
ncbi:MAG: hypothetical protein J5I47_04215 [Vicingus serpentipes]|nr:hypothetical protein [Vicingus serpentipes]